MKALNKPAELYMPDLTKAAVWWLHYTYGEGMKYRHLLTKTHPEMYSVLCQAFLDEALTPEDLQDVLDQVAEVINLEIIKE